MIGPVETLRLDGPDRPAAPAFRSASIIPSRGMLLLQAVVRMPDGREVEVLASPPADEAATVLDGGAADFAGNASFSLGGAVLLPYANRIRGRPVEPGRLLETKVLGRTVRLPRNWGGKAPGAETYAMHGLVLAARAGDLDREGSADGQILRGAIQAGDFGGHWLSRTLVEIEYDLRPASLALTVTARNVGAEPLPMGIGWHPYFNLPSGLREQARLRVPARARLEVNDYDEVLPTGGVLPVDGTPYDFTDPGGRPLGDLYLDDCFVDLQREDGELVAVITDPAAGYGLRIRSPSPEVRAMQTYAPPGKAYVVVEPQFNWPDPYGPAWPAGTDTGMAVLEPGETARYRAVLEPFAP